MDKFVNIGWPDMLLMALVGFLIVFFVLVLMIGVMKAMGYFFTHQRKAKVAAAGGSVEDEEHAISDAEIVAAIAVALKLYKSDLHDRESEVLTINRITRAYSPWNSKIHGLTQLPTRKK
jgi:Na+-transporting methylmalonyl-CoA/oxaloacetate decarboxylase gamma subunit